MAHAQALRKTESVVEERLWSELRGCRSDGLKFRRQHPVPPYVLDFAERKLKLAIEIDGPSHFVEGAADRDTARTAYLETKCWTVIRFTNADVIEDIDAVVEAIWLKAMELRDAK